VVISKNNTHIDAIGFRPSFFLAQFGTTASACGLLSLEVGLHGDRDSGDLHRRGFSEQSRPGIFHKRGLVKVARTSTSAQTMFEMGPGIVDKGGLVPVVAAAVSF
jgi:hypothetical protein